MREQEVRELYEAYLQVHQPQEEVEHLDENVQDAVKGALEKGANFMKTNPVGKAVSKIIAPVGGGRKTPTATSGGYRKEEIDLFDAILEHLVAEGYADTNESALAIMANMSEEWRESIVEDAYAAASAKYNAMGGDAKAKQLGVLDKSGNYVDDARRKYNAMGGDAKAKQLGVMK